MLSMLDNLTGETSEPSVTSVLVNREVVYSHLQDTDVIVSKDAYFLVLIFRHVWPRWEFGKYDDRY